MSIQFYLPSRYNNILADKGVWFDIETEAGQRYGKFKCKLIDSTGQRAELLQKRIKQNHGASLKKMTGAEFQRTLLVEEVLVDWDVKDATGKPVPFTKENANAYFAIDAVSYVVDKLLALAGDVTNFGDEEPIADIEKN